MQPSDVLRMIRDYLAYPDESRKVFKFWLQKRHPQYGSSNGVILFWWSWGLLTFVIAMQCVGSQVWWPMYIPFGLWLTKELWGSIMQLWNSLHSPAKKFKSYARPKRESKMGQAIRLLLLLWLLRWFPSLATMEVEVTVEETEPESADTPEAEPAVIAAVIVEETDEAKDKLEAEVEVGVTTSPLLARIKHSYEARGQEWSPTMATRFSRIAAKVEAAEKRAQTRHPSVFSPRAKETPAVLQSTPTPRKRKTKKPAGRMARAWNWLMTPSSIEEKINDRLTQTARFILPDRVRTTFRFLVWLPELALKVLIKDFL